MKKDFRYYFYMFSRFLLYLLSLLWFRLSIKGKENLPGFGKYIFASNHVSNLDPILCGLANPWPLNYLAKKELFEIPVIGKLITTYYGVPIDRKRGDLKAIKKALEILNSNKPLLIFPEGTRNEKGEIGEAKRGIGFIVEKTNAPVVPCYIDGSYRAFRKKSKFIYPVKIRMLIGKPIYFDDLINNNALSRDERQYEISKRIIEEIKNLKSKMEN